MAAITIYDNEAFLRQKSKKVSFPDKDLEVEVEVVKEFCRSRDDTFALASIQLGIVKRIIVIKSDSSDCKPKHEKDWLILINPEIISQCGKTEFWESCVSGASNIALVERPYKMKVRYQTMDGTFKTADFEGFVCTVLSHEIDHLEGIFHMDRGKELIQIEWENREARYALRRKYPYKVISKTCEFKYSPIKIKNLK